MKEVKIPGFGNLELKNVILDVNGTIQFKGKISWKLKKKIRDLKKKYVIYLLSADTRGNLEGIARKLGVSHIKIDSEGTSESEAKNRVLEQLGRQVTVAMGNGNNDALMLKNAIIGICIIGSEGASKECVKNSDVIMLSPLNAIDFLLDDKLMIATLRS